MRRLDASEKAAVATVLSFATGSDLSWFAMTFFGLLVLPLAMTFNRPAGTPRRLAVAYTAVVALMALPVLSLIVLGPASPFAREPKRAFEFFNYFLWGAVLSSWAANLLGSRFSSCGGEPRLRRTGRPFVEVPDEP